MNDLKSHVEGIYFNTSDSPVFLEGMTVGGHEYVYVEGYLRIPGHFVLVKDPKENPDAPETFRAAYRKMVEKGESQKQETHANSANRRSNVIPVTEEKAEEEPKPKPTRTSRKGKSDSTSSDESAQ